jgi:hypothetical protein
MGMRLVEREAEAGSGASVQRGPRSLVDERRRARRLRVLVDCTMDLLMHEPMTRVQAEALVETTRAAVLDLFPGSESTYNLLLAPRFARVIGERCGRSSGRPLAKVLPFRPVARIGEAR